MKALERDGQRRPLFRRQPALGGFGSQPQLLQRLGVGREIHAMPRLDVREQPLDDRPVEVVAAEMRVAVGRQDLEDAILDPEDGDVEGAAAEVVDGDHALGQLLESVGERSCRRLVDDAQHLEAGDAAGVLGRLALGVVEVGRHGDDGSLDRLARDGPPPGA